MKLSDHKELKREILNLPAKEKDKILLRLIAKDKILTERMHFLLLEDQFQLKERVDALRSEFLKVDFTGLTARETMVTVRKQIAAINKFYKITKSNPDEVELRLVALNNTKLDTKSKYFSSYKDYEFLFQNYYMKLVLATWNKYLKLHEDLQFDLKDDFNKLFVKLSAHKLAAQAEQMGLPHKI